MLDQNSSVRSCRTFIHIPAKITEICILKDVMVLFETFMSGQRAALLTCRSCHMVPKRDRKLDKLGMMISISHPNKVRRRLTSLMGLGASACTGSLYAIISSLVTMNAMIPTSPKAVLKRLCCSRAATVSQYLGEGMTHFVL